MDGAGRRGLLAAAAILIDLPARDQRPTLRTVSDFGNSIMLSEQERIKHEMTAADQIRAGFKRFGHEAGGQAKIESARAVSEARDQVVLGGWFGKGHQQGSAPASFSSVYGTAATTESAGSASVYGKGPANDGGSIHGNGPATETGTASVHGPAPATPETGSIHGNGPGAETSNTSVYGTAPSVQPPSTIHGPPQKKGPEVGLGG